MINFNVYLVTKCFANRIHLQVRQEMDPVESQKNTLFWYRFYGLQGYLLRNKNTKKMKVSQISKQKCFKFVLCTFQALSDSPYILHSPRKFIQSESFLDLRSLSYQQIPYLRKNTKLAPFLILQFAKACPGYFSSVAVYIFSV